MCLGSECHVECHYAEYITVFVLSVVMLCVIMLCVIMLSVIMLSVIMLSVVMLSVVMLSVLAPHLFFLLELTKLLRFDINYKVSRHACAIKRIMEVIFSEW